MKEAEIEAQRQRWESFKKVYHQLLEHHAFKDAANHLAKSESRSEDWQKLVREFPGELHKRVESQVEASLKSNRYDVAHSQLKTAVSASELLELTLRESQPALAKAILAGCSKSLTPISTRIDREQDQTLYAKVIKHRDVSACEEYLAGDRSMAMKAMVQAYHAYLITLTGPLAITVSAFVTWDKGYDLGDHNIVTVSADSSVKLKSKGYVKATPGATSGVIGTFTLPPAKLATAVKFSANIVEEDDFYVAGYDDDGGSGTATFTIEELRTGQRTFPLRPSDRSNLTNTLILKVTGGFPAEPSLSPWRQP